MGEFEWEIGGFTVLVSLLELIVAKFDANIEICIWVSFVRCV